MHYVIVRVRLLLLGLALGAAALSASANTSGIAPTGTDVTVKDSGDGTVTMANGIVSILLEKAANRINSVQYTGSNSGAPRTVETIMPHNHFRWGGFPLGGHTFVYSLAVDPATNGGSYGDVMLLNTSSDNGVFEIHYSMLRGSSGFYTTGTLTHRAQDKADAIGAWGALTWVPVGFNWGSMNAMHNYALGPTPVFAHGSNVPDSAHELTVQKTGRHAGEFDDKFMYADDRANLAAWGWSSVGPGGLNVGVWMMSLMEFSDAGPLKRDVAEAIDRGVDESILTDEVGMGGDNHFAEGEVAVNAAPVPPAPAAAPDGLAGTWTKGRNGDVITLKWSAVPGAVGYVIYRSDGVDTSFEWPKNFLTTLVETTYMDRGNTEKNAKVKGLDKSTTYSYQVTAVNAGGVSPPTVVQVSAQ